MGKIRTRILGDTELEEEQKREAKERAERKKEMKKDESVEAPEKTDANPEKQDKKPKKKFDATSKKKEKVRGKAYLELRKKVDPKKAYPLHDAVKLLKELGFAKFDESIELHLNVLETGLRGEVSLPHGTGKSVRVAIVDDAVLTALEQGKMDFDVLVAHPSYMPKLARFARVLGPKGLMPNPKAGTIGPEPEKIAEKFKKGSVRWKTEPKAPLIHQLVGKSSLQEAEIVANIKEFIRAVELKNITKVFVKRTMSPAIQIDLTTLA